MTLRKARSKASSPVVVANADAMRLLGASVAEDCRPGDVVLLSGPLGAGKTTFAQGFAEGLGVTGAVTSPTFVIARTHRSGVGGPDLVHVDAYRLSNLAELDDLDLDTSLAESVTLVEWGAGLADHLVDDPIIVTIERDAPGMSPAAGTRTSPVSGPTSEVRLVTVEFPGG